jgi:hypothetical protein
MKLLVYLGFNFINIKKNNMLLDVEFKSIYMGDGLRYVVNGIMESTGEKRGKVLSLNESKFIHAMNAKEKCQYAEKLLFPITEGRFGTIKLFDVVWLQNGIKHHQRIKASDEKAAVDRVHSRGGSVVTLQQVSFRQ